VLEPGHLAAPNANHAGSPMPTAQDTAAMQWELNHLLQSIATAKQQEKDVL